MQSVIYLLIKTVKNFITYPFVVKLDRWVGNCNTLNDLPNKVCHLNKTRFKSKCLQHDYKNKWITKHWYIRMQI